MCPKNMRQTFFYAAEIDEMKRKVAEEDWAGDLLRKSVEAGRSGTEEEWVPKTFHAKAGTARNIALLYAVTGDDSHLQSMVDLFREELSLDTMDQTLDAERPDDVSALNARHDKNSQVGQWTYGMFRSGFFYAYDLTRSHPVWQKDGMGERVEQRFKEIMQVQKPMVKAVRGWGNTNTWYAGTVAMLGGLLGDDEAVDLAIAGPLGYKSMLGMLDDGRFWPEPMSYGGAGYVNCVLTIIAEVARHQEGRDDLYHWETSDGISLKNMYEGMLSLLLADGCLPGHGDGGSPSLLTGGATFEIAYRVYGDPRYAWLLARNPARDRWDKSFWGYAALTHGVPLGETRPPDAASRVWRGYGAALVRGDESDAYWEGSAPAVYLRKGQLQGHGHTDMGNILLHAHDRILYPDRKVGWDYQGRIDPETGRDVNPTPLSKRRIAHNTVSVDCGEGPELLVVQPDKANQYIGKLGAISRTGPMKAATFRDNDDVQRIRRTIGVTPEYVFDWVCAGSVVGPGKNKEEHIFDYHLYGVGIPELHGIENQTLYTTLGEEYGIGVIDTRASSPENQWIRPGLSGSTDDQWQAVIREEQPKDQENPRGVLIQGLGEPGTQIITGNIPDQVSQEGWDATQIENGGPGPGRRGLLLVRRRAMATEFIIVHQPFCGRKPDPLKISREGDLLHIQGTDFRDEIELPFVKCSRY